MKPEEKGSNVNLATHMVNDAWKNLYDVALIISNDSDLVEAIHIVKSERSKVIVLANPFLWSRRGIAIVIKDNFKRNEAFSVKRESKTRWPSKCPLCGGEILGKKLRKCSKAALTQQ